MGTLKKIVKKVLQKPINEHRGKVGEAKVNSKLNPWLFGKVEHRQINGLILVDEYGKSHQIDHVEIRENGIFCIETKNFIGLIYGSEFEEYWTQALYNGEKNQLKNPLKQNKSHIYHLQKVLGRKYRINSLVVMVQNNAPNIHLPNVINLDDLRDYLKHYNDGTYYTVEEMDKIYNALLAAGSKMTHREHVKNINKTQKELKKGICPRCGGKLVERNGNYGKFYGCSNYPNCKFTLNIK